MTVLPDDHDEKWGYTGHTRAKHDLLRYYLVQWVKKLSGPNNDRKLRLFDCFAGRGAYVEPGNGEPINLEYIEYRTEIPGSPLIMLDVASQLSHIAREIECVFIEPKEKNRSILENIIEYTYIEPNNVTYQIEPGRFQDDIIDVVEKTGGCDSSIPSFFFIDPFGYDDLDYDIITELGTQRRFEVFINLMAQQLVRWQDDESKADALETLFGTPNWREELKSYSSEYWDDDEVEYYCDRLQEGGISHTIAYLTTRKESDQMVYYMVHGSTHPDALEHMRNAMDECGTGRFAYAPNKAALHEDQTGLTEFSTKPPEDQFKQYLLANFAGESITFDNINRKIIEKDEYIAFRRQDIREILKELRSEGVIETTSVTSKTKRGLQGKDIVHFPQGNFQD